MSSSCSDSIDKKLEEGGPQLATLYPVSSVLPTVDEKDEDEAAKVVGFERNPYTEEEARAVRRKVDRRVSRWLDLRRPQSPTSASSERG